MFLSNEDILSAARAVVTILFACDMDFFLVIVLLRSKVIPSSALR